MILHRALVEVKLPLECVSDAWKALFLELAVNCRRTSRNADLRTHGPADLCTYDCGPMNLHTYGPTDLDRVKISKFYCVKTKILAFGFCSSSSQSYVWMFDLEFLYNLSDFGCIW